MVENENKMEKEAIIKRCRDICRGNNKKDSIDLIRKEYDGCAIAIIMDYTIINGHSMKQFMGMLLWKNFDISF